MAEFTSDFSAPTGAGSSPIQGVQVQPTKEISMAEGLGSIFTHELAGAKKAVEKEQKGSVVGAYTREMQALNDAFKTGQLSPAAFQTEARSRYAKYAGMFEGAYNEDLQRAVSGFEKYSNLATAEETVQSEKKMRDSDISSASTAGYRFLPGMSTSQQDSLIAAHKTSVREKEKWDAYYKQRDQEMKETNFDYENDKRTREKMSFETVNTVASTQLKASQAHAVRLGDMVRSGQMTPEQAQAELMERNTNVMAALQSAAAMNPQFAAPYRQVFEEIHKVGLQLIDPKQDAEQAKAKYDAWLNKAKLYAVTNDPVAGAVVATSSALGNVAPVAIKAGPAAASMVKSLSGMLSNQYGVAGKYTPQVIGNPETEKPVLDLLKKALGDHYKGLTEDKTKAGGELDNSLNHILGQVGKHMQEGTPPEQMKNIAAFCASSEFGRAAAGGGLDEEAKLGCKIAFQQNYEPAIVKGVTEKIAGKPVVAQWNGAGISFVPTSGKQGEQQALIRELSTSTKAVNQLIYIGAHMGGTTDYKAYFEATKHMLLPTMFSAPEPAKAGGTSSPKQQPATRTSSTGSSWWNQ